MLSLGGYFIKMDIMAYIRQWDTSFLKFYLSNQKIMNNLFVLINKLRNVYRVVNIPKID